MLQLITSALIALTGSWIAIISLVPVAERWGLVDKPTDRKQHTGIIPLVGGPAVFVGVFACAALQLYSIDNIEVFLIAAFAIVALGIIDDRVDLSPKVKIVGQILIALFFIYTADLRIDQVGNILNQGTVFLGPFSVLFTAACMIGVINAINMIDGVDGLAGSVVALTTLTMTGLALSVGAVPEATVLASVSATVIAFLYFNARVVRQKAVVFLGDSGSMLLGFILVWFFIQLSQVESPAFSAVAAGWLFGLPLADIVSVIVGRLRQGRSPFAAGRDHLHHQILDAGFSVNQTITTILGIHFLFILVGVTARHSSAAEPILFWAFVAVVVMHHYLTPLALQLARRKIIEA